MQWSSIQKCSIIAPSAHAKDMDETYMYIANERIHSEEATYYRTPFMTFWNRWNRDGKQVMGGVWNIPYDTLVMITCNYDFV